MQFEEYWAAMIAKNPKLADDNAVAEMPVAKLRKIQRQAFRLGAESVNRPVAVEIDAMFAELFGGRRR